MEKRKQAKLYLGAYNEMVKKKKMKMGKKILNEIREEKSTLLKSRDKNYIQLLFRNHARKKRVQ
jgi:hypothetical protein